MILIAIIIGCIIGAIIGINAPVIPYTYSTFLKPQISTIFDIEKSLVFPYIF